MINCIIIDDEKPARDALELLIIHYFQEKITVLGKAGSLKEGITLIASHKPDIVFLDIEMQEENGFSIFNYYKQVPFSVIFTTAYREYAIKAIKVAALDYILKPVSVDDLRETISLYEKHQLSSISNVNIEKLVNALNPLTSRERKISLPTFSGFQLVKINSIIYCKADQNYTTVFINDGIVLMISKPLSFVEELLPDNLFYRVHKSYLVNLNFVKTYSRADGYHIILEDETKLPVATRRNDEFVLILNQNEH
jgi:two-component system, LytTR family, response regulator